MVVPAVKRNVVSYLKTYFKFSERAACRLIGFSRSVNRHSSCRPDDELLCTQLKRLSVQFPDYGYLMLHELLRAQGLVTNKKRTYRLYRREGLQIGNVKKFGFRIPIFHLVPTSGQMNEAGSLDYVYEKLIDGRYLRVLNAVDELSRTMIGQLAVCSIHGHMVAYFVD